MQYDNFLLRLYPYPAAPDGAPPDPPYQAQVLLPSSAGGAPFALDFTAADLRALQEHVEVFSPIAEYGPRGWADLGFGSVAAGVREAADSLRESLPPDVRDAITAALNAARRQDRGLRIGLLVEAGTLAALPWEMLETRSGQAGYLALSDYSPVLRLVETPAPPRPWAPGAGRSLRSNNGNRLILGLPPADAPPRQVLVVAAGAPGAAFLAGAEAEAEAICAVLRAGEAAVVDLLRPPVSFARFAEALETRAYDAIHIITHGGVDDGHDLAYLLFDPAPCSDDAAAPAEKVIATRFAALLAGQGHLTLLVLSACRSADPRPASAAGGRFAAGLAPEIARTAGIAVVGMQYEILAPAAAPGGDPAGGWAAAFYRQLRLGAGLEPAVAAARRALAVDKEPVLWAAPVLYVPLYWPGPPPPLYRTLDRALYASLAAIMEGDGQVVQEGLLVLGLLLAAALALGGLFALPADPGDTAALTGAAISLLLATVVLPLPLAAGVLALEGRRRPGLRRFRGIALLLAYGGAGMGILTALAGVSALALILHALGWAHPVLTTLLQGLALCGAVGYGLVFAGRFVDTYDSVTAPNHPLDWRGHLALGLGAVIFGGAFALLLPIGYGLLIDPHLGVAVLAAVCLIVGLASLWGGARRRG